MHSPRAQCDKKLYQFTMKRWVEEQENLTLRQELVEGLLLEDFADSGEPGDAGASSGVVARGDTRYRAPAVILTTGHVPQGDHAHRRGEDRRRPGRGRRPPRR